MKKHGLFFFICWFSMVLQAQQIVLLTGVVRDSTSHETMPGVNVYVLETKGGTATDQNGQFSLSLPRGRYHVSISFTGYQTKVLAVELNRPVRMDIQLVQKLIETTEVEITSEAADRNVSGVGMGIDEVDLKQAEVLPVLMGEADPIKLLQLTPGVQTTGDGNTGLYIRGGSPGHNLIKLDDAVVYNPAHLMGFFSVFNANAVQKVTLYKSSVPVAHGGRLASALLVEGKDPSLLRRSVKADIGVLSSKCTIEQPLVSNKASVMVSGRHSYLGPIRSVAGFFGEQVTEFFDNTSYQFLDLNAKANWLVSDKDVVRFSLYNGSDHYRYGFSDNDHTVISWGNQTGSMKWTHACNTEVYYQHVLSYSGYGFHFGAEQQDFLFNIRHQVREGGYSFLLHYDKKPRHQMMGGVEVMRHVFSPLALEGRFISLDLNFYELTDMLSNEISVFAEDDFVVSDRLRISGGLRYTQFMHLGPYASYERDELGAVSDTLHYRKGESIARYGAPEPRLNLRWSLNEWSSVKLSSALHYQYLHFAALPSISMPYDIWLPSTKGLRPSSCWQSGAGYYRNFLSDRLEAYAELYYRKYYNLIDFKKSVLNSAFEQNLYNDIITGDGTSYGLELSVKKTKGNLTGWFSATLSKALRDIPEISENSYVAAFDRPVDLSLVLNYRHKKWTISAVGVYASGKPITIPERLYVIQEVIISEYGERNGFRLPAYHRADVAAGYRMMEKKNVRADLLLSVYNVYNRANPFFMYFETTGNLEDYELKITPRQISLFPVIPAITLKMQFE